jgi:ribonuclease D
VSATAHEWIDSGPALESNAARWCSQRAVALDTEFVFERTYRPRLGLVQIADSDRFFLVDTVALPDLSPLGPWLRAPDSRKVVHAGSGDISILRRASGGPVAGLFDTQIAAAFAGLGPALSYAALIRDLFGVDLPKHETRTDWLQRPLRPAQLRYAVEDVEHLLPAASELERRLIELGRLEWALEDSERLAAIEETDPESAWRRVRGIGRLPAGARAVARELAAWREREAERLDLARPFLMRDETLIALARRVEIDDSESARLPGFDRRRHARHLSSWRRALELARDSAADADLEERPRPSRAEIARRERLDRALAAAIATCASELELLAEILLSRRRRERLLSRRVDNEPISTGLEGFRRQLLGELLDAVLC